ncbi:uncharacterized protein [Dermacentor albipictus]|uniref:uncharacterized protein isoform X2 n=1 Tax=Dermacentor albipictus TaxID=60249 RepID=UPI0031FD7C7D
MQAIPGPPIFGAVQEPPMLAAVPPPYLYTGPKMPSKVEAESTENTFALCRQGQAPGSELRRGVYGLEYADHSGSCPIVLSGAYARTRLAKALVRFFESRPNVDNMTDCFDIRPEAEKSVRS